MISELGYLVIGTRDLSGWRAFAENVIGAMVLVAGEDALYVKIDKWQHRLLIIANERECLLASAWAVRDPEAYRALRSKLVDAGVEIKDLDGGDIELRVVEEAFTFTDPAGNRHEIFWGRAQDGERFVSPVGVANFVTGDLGLGHVVLPTGDHFDETARFWESHLNLKLSDFSKRKVGLKQRRVHFYHLENRRQHSLALAETSVEQNLLHFMFEVETLDEVGHAIDRCHKHGAFIARSLGRHVNDGVVSIYIDTPSGFHIEFGYGGFEMDWKGHEPFNAKKGSHWGHVWADRE